MPRGRSPAPTKTGTTQDARDQIPRTGLYVQGWIGNKLFLQGVFHTRTEIEDAKIHAQSRGLHYQEYRQREGEFPKTLDDPGGEV